MLPDDASLFFSNRTHNDREYVRSLMRKNVQLPPKVTTLINIFNQILLAKKVWPIFYLMKRFGLGLLKRRAIIYIELWHHRPDYRKLTSLG